MEENTGYRLLDRGFDDSFGSERLAQFLECFTAEEAVREVVERVHREDRTLDMKRGEYYPEILRWSRSLERAAGQAYGIDEQQVLPNFGSNGSIDTIMVAMKLREVRLGASPQSGGGVLVSTPTYFRNYNSAKSKGLALVKVPLIEPEFRFDEKAFLAALARHPTAAWFVSPNNPTGIPLPDDVLLRVLDAVPEDTLAVIDRTLVNVAPEMPSAQLLARYRGKQLAILHSMSKYAGLSHLRVGFALYSRQDVANEIRPHLPLGMGVEGSVRTTAALLRGPLQGSPRIVENIRASKRLLAGFCERARGFTCTDFMGNYCLLRLQVGLNSRQITDSLEKGHGVYLMGGHEFPDEPRDDMLRIHTGGPPEFMAQTIEALEVVIRELR